MKKMLSDADLVQVFGSLWEERMDHIRRGLILSALWGGVVFVFWWITTVSSGTNVWLWLAVWGAVQLVLVVDAWIRVLRVDRRASDVLGRSEAWLRLLGKM